MKKLIIAAVVALTSFGASAECWIVGDMKGTSYADRNAYAPELDGFSGTFIISIDGRAASVKYSGDDTGGIDYVSLSPNSLVGISSDGKMKNVVDSWAIQPDGKVLMSKTVTGFGEFDSVKAFVGEVKDKC